MWRRGTRYAMVLGSEGICRVVILGGWGFFFLPLELSSNGVQKDRQAEMQTSAGLEDLVSAAERMCLKYACYDPFPWKDHTKCVLPGEGCEKRAFKTYRREREDLRRNKAPVECVRRRHGTLLAWLGNLTKNIMLTKL